MASILIVAPFFPVLGDLCWDSKNDTLPAQIILEGADSACGYPVWSAEGWKDGHLSVAPVASGTNTLYSYDVFNTLISHLGDPVNFPNLRNITVFGFSAGAQTILRYSALPAYTIKNAKISQPRFVISDPSTYLYFTPERPYHEVSADGFQQVS